MNSIKEDAVLLQKYVAEEILPLIVELKNKVNEVVPRLKDLQERINTEMPENEEKEKMNIAVEQTMSMVAKMNGELS